MSNNTTNTSLISLDDETLASVIGGCKGKQCRCSNSSNVVVNNINNSQPVPAPLPEPAISTSVDVAYR